MQVSLRYWSFALHFISLPQNRSKLLPDTRPSSTATFAAPHTSASGSGPYGTSSLMLTSRYDDDGAAAAAVGAVSHRAVGRKEGGTAAAITARTRAKETYNAYDENQVISM